MLKGWNGDTQWSTINKKCLFRRYSIPHTTSKQNCRVEYRDRQNKFTKRSLTITHCCCLLKIPRLYPRHALQHQFKQQRFMIHHVNSWPENLDVLVETHGLHPEKYEDHRLKLRPPRVLEHFLNSNWCGGGMLSLMKKMMSRVASKR